jgi:hypothetical protein
MKLEHVFLARLSLDFLSHHVSLSTQTFEGLIAFEALWSSRLLWLLDLSFAVMWLVCMLCSFGTRLST